MTTEQKDLKIAKDRLLAMYAQLAEGKPLYKAREAVKYNCSLRSIQRDIEDLRSFFADRSETTGVVQELIYDRKLNAYRLVPPLRNLLTNEETFAVLKVLLESRSLTKSELFPILEKLISCCVPPDNRRQVTDLIANEKYHYGEPRHKKEILEIKKAYNTPRLSKIGNDKSITIVASEENDESGKNFVLAISAGNTIKKVTSKNYSMSQKTLSDNSTITDIAKQVETFSGSDTVLIFTSQGNAIKVNVGALKECKWRDKGFSLLSIEKSTVLNEIPVCIMKMPKEGQILFMTKQGMVKKSEASDIVVNKSFYQVCKLSDGDEVISVELDKMGKSILMLSRKGMSLNFEKGDIPTQGRISGGVRGINLEEGDSVIFASQLDYSHVVVVTDNGFIKKIPCTQFALSARYRKGLRYVNFAKNCQNVFYACSANGNITLAVDFGLKILALDTKKLPESDRLSSGNEIIKKNFFTINKMN